MRSKLTCALRCGAWAAAGALAVLCGSRTLLAAESAKAMVLLDFAQGFDLRAVEAWDAKVSLAGREGGTVLRLETGHKLSWPGIKLKAPQGAWDLSRYEFIAFDVRNVGGAPASLNCSVENPGAASGHRDCVEGSLVLGPGESGVLRVILWRKAPEAAAKLVGMRGLPGLLTGDARSLDVRNVVQIVLVAPRPTADQALEIKRVRAEGAYAGPVLDEGFFPFMDEYGQYMHKDWPGKIHASADFARRREAEAGDLAQHPGPEDWDRYGGWKAGPAFPATGFFHPEKREGRWWLVDPEGRPFWSHGMDCVRVADSTPITDRKRDFKDLPAANSPLAQFYAQDSWAPQGYYRGRHFETYNFLGANLCRKYGPQWLKDFGVVTHQRLRSWGLNSIGNWSAADVYLARKTPYALEARFDSRPIEGSAGYWRKFPDPFDAAFRADLLKVLEGEKGKSVGDPWCLGYFVNNELSWGKDGLSLALAALASPADQAAKRAFVEELKAKYGKIEKLNAAWGAAHASWEALLQDRRPPDQNKAGADLAAFYTRLAEQYFRTVKEAIHEAAPNNLYLGCRFGWGEDNERAVRAAARFCDVLSFNLYVGSVAEFRLPAGLDKAVLVGEFSFGALDRGLFHPGLLPVSDQQERGAAYRGFVLGALRNPAIVGAHWFQYTDQPTTGRGDGENYQFGFIDIGDTPYPETVSACREVGYHLYELRAGERPTASPPPAVPSGL